MKKVIIALVAMSCVLSMALAEKNTAKVVGKGAMTTYFEVSSYTQSEDLRTPKKYMVRGPKEIGVVYGLNNDWAIGGSMQLMIDTLAIPNAKDDYFTYVGPISISAQKPMGQIDLLGLKDVDLKAVFSYDLTPLKLNVNKKVTGADEATMQYTNLVATVKASKEVMKSVTVGGSLSLINTTIKDDPDNNFESPVKSKLALGYSLGADYAVNADTVAYLILTHSFDSTGVKNGGFNKDDAGSIVLGGQMNL